MGYQYKPAIPWRHVMRFGAYHPQDPTGFTFVQSTDIMAHELGKHFQELLPLSELTRPGHVIGFNHEHQRPDAEQYIRIAWKNVQGYDEAATKVLAVNDGTFDPAMGYEARMDKVYVCCPFPVKTKLLML